MFAPVVGDNEKQEGRSFSFCPTVSPPELELIKQLLSRVKSHENLMLDMGEMRTGRNMHAGNLTIWYNVFLFYQYQYQ